MGGREHVVCVHVEVFLCCSSLGTRRIPVICSIHPLISAKVLSIDPLGG
jgi:hypothetical protein